MGRFLQQKFRILLDDLYGQLMSFQYSPQLCFLEVLCYRLCTNDGIVNSLQQLGTNDRSSGDMNKLSERFITHSLCVHLTTQLLQMTFKHS